MTAPGAATRAAALERLRLWRGIAFLPAIVTTAPMLGTLGTVVSMPHVIPLDASSLGDVAQQGFSEALFPVVFGLAVAIVAQLVYGALSNRAATLTREAIHAAKLIPPPVPGRFQARPLPTRITIELARSAALRAAANEHLRMKRCFRHLPNVISLAPWVGLLGTVVGVIVYLSKGVTGERSTGMFVFIEFLSDAFLPTAASLAIATFAYHLYQHLRTQTESLALEMETVADAFAAKSRCS